MFVGSDCGNSSFLGFGYLRNGSQKSEMMVFLPLLLPHRLYATTFSKTYAGLSPKDDEPKIQKKKHWCTFTQNAALASNEAYNAMYRANRCVSSVSAIYRVVSG
jgi:hypothetical protein